ncbi:MAG: PDZ domain-containing protein [Dehalococcoidia bacterium]
MQGLRRNLLPILVGVAAVLVSLASVTVIIDHFRGGPGFAFGFGGRGGMMQRGQFGHGGFGMPGGQMYPGQMMPGGRDGYRGMMPGGQGGYPGMMPGGRQQQPSQQRPLLGVSGSEEQGGVRVQQVQPGSAAERAGVKIGDVIIRADGKDTPSIDALRSAVAAVDTNKQQYDLVVKRDGNEQTLKVDAPRQARQQPQATARPGA